MHNHTSPTRHLPPGIRLIEEVNFLMPVNHTLSNEIPVYLQQGGSQDIVKVEFVFKSGSFHQQIPLQAYAMANLLKNGTLRKTAVEINQLWDFYGASLQIDAQKDIISVGFVSLIRHLPAAMDLLLEMITMPLFPEEELSIFLTNRKQQHLVDIQKVEYMARAQFPSLIFGNEHPYGKCLVAEDFDRLTRDDLLNFYKDNIHPANCVCFVAGKYPPEMTSILDNSIARFQWHSRQLPGVNTFETQKNAIRKHHLSKHEALQSALRIGKSVISRHHTDHHKLSITNALLGGYFGSRLMQNIRQDKGYTYGISSAVVNLVHSAYFFIASQVRKELASKAIEEVYNEIRSLRLNPASAHELEMLKNYLSASFLRSFDGPFMQGERFKEILLFNQDYTFFQQHLNTIRFITSLDIQETAEKYLHEDNMTELVVG